MRSVLATAGWIGLLIAPVMILVASKANAVPLYLRTMPTHFPDGKITHRCQACHAGAPRLNAFGKDFASSVLQRGMSNPEGWSLLKSLDSDQDGVSNLDEINAGTNPGKADVAPVPASDTDGGALVDSAT